MATTGTLAIGHEEASSSPAFHLTRLPDGKSAAQHPPPERYLDHATITLTTAALLVLMTRIKAKLDNTGKWSIEIDKKAASDSLLKLLVQRFLSLPPK